VGKKQTAIGIKISFLFLCSFLYAQGNTIFQEWKKRFFALVYHHKYLLCCYAVNGISPRRVLPLEGYTVDYLKTTCTQGMVIWCCMLFINGVAKGGPGWARSHQILSAYST